MNFESNINSIAMIGFDVTQGPVLKWKKIFNEQNSIDLERLYTNFYIIFRGGKFKPRAVIFEDFQIVAFPNKLDILCVFLDNKINEENYRELEKIAEREKQNQNISNTEEFKSESDQIKEKLIKILKEEEEMTIKQLKKHFPLSYWTIRRYLTDLEDEDLVDRNKEGRSHLWYVK
ncbi:MAG: transcriptional regulator [Promethearchaeota archaeon]|nr:MAG: transcriptional regulator [Candidatus Lokiarchaeota archaeon]